MVVSVWFSRSEVLEILRLSSSPSLWSCRVELMTVQQWGEARCPSAIGRSVGLWLVNVGSRSTARGDGGLGWVEFGSEDHGGGAASSPVTGSLRSNLFWSDATSSFSFQEISSVVAAPSGRWSTSICSLLCPGCSSVDVEDVRTSSSPVFSVQTEYSTSSVLVGDTSLCSGGILCPGMCLRRRHSAAAASDWCLSSSPSLESILCRML